MSFDPSKLTPAPWRVHKPRKSNQIKSGDMFVMEQGSYGVRTDADAEFIALARNAFDVMMRRGWNPSKSPISDNWRIDTNDGGYFTMPLDADDTEPWEFSDPFTALVEADRWFSENVERGHS